MNALDDEGHEKGFVLIEEIVGGQCDEHLPHVGVDGFLGDLFVAVGEVVPEFRNGADSHDKIDGGLVAAEPFEELGIAEVAPGWGVEGHNSSSG